ncbi:uncharacterized protein BDV17DRAFT_183030 [Aspergillus undulatus]|uniref:uncharacterized protein n=1 Tax=Aspergillus undulatus TaxID=1810928 RepID=UPI003CCDA821
MDLQMQRLAFTSGWAFEDIGVQELENELHREIPQAECHCDYSQNEEALVVKGKLEGCLAPIAELIHSFVEKQKTKDLLDKPRLRLLILPSAIQDTSSVTDCPNHDAICGLVALDDDAAKFIPHVRSQVTKFWWSIDGGVGCFTANKHTEALSGIAKGTGTEIIVVDNEKGVRVSGERENDVNDALEKLHMIDKPLSYLDSSNIGNLVLGPIYNEARYRVQPYDTLGTEALRRVLADSELGRMFVSMLYFLDEETEIYKPPRNLIQPPMCTTENKDSRIWSDFMYHEVGNGDKFATLEPVLNSPPANSQLPPLQDAASHPYLSLEKASQVTRWVADRLTPEATEAVKQFEDAAGPQNQMLPLASTRTDIKQAPGIKKRRAVIPSQKIETKDTKQLSPEIVPYQPQIESRGLEPTAMVNTYRQIWKMQYEPDVNSTRGLQGPVIQAEKPPPHDPLDRSTARTLKPGLTGAKSRKTTSVARSKKEPQASAACKRLIQPAVKPSNKHDKLIDDSTPVDTTKSSCPPFRFNTPPLVPNMAASSSAARSLASSGSEQSMVPVDKHHDGLAGLNMAETAHSDGSIATPEPLPDAPLSAKLPDLEARLKSVNDAYSIRSVSVGSNPPARPCQRPGDYCRLLSKQVGGDLERAKRPEAAQSVDEMQTREFNKTMNQKATKPNQKTRKKAAAKQATLEAAWGMPNPKKPLGKSQSLNVSPGTNSKATLAPAHQASSPKQQGPVVEEDVRQLFDVMKPTLGAAEAFPGILTFEMQFGLIVVPLLPRTCIDNLMSQAEWSKIFQSRTGAAAPTTKFVNRLTVCGSEIDHIVDLKTSKGQGKSRMFGQEYSEYGISYEFHCRTKADELLLIAFDEQGGYTIQTPKSVLGAVNLHSPGQIWDARAVVGSAALYQSGSHPEFEDVAKYMAEHLWIPADKHISIHTSVPKRTKMNIEKVFMKRWTRHRYLGPEGSKDMSQASDGSSIFLQVTEVQDLFIGLHESPDNQHVRARYSNSAEMIQRGKVWFELSLISSAIEALLKTNTALEIGERTQHWRCSDLFGDVATLLTGQPPSSPNSPVAAAVGQDGIADLLRISKAVLEKMDGVGACNRGPMSPDMRVMAPMLQENNGLKFEEIESMKDVQSVVARVEFDPSEEEAIKQEQEEKDYW